MKAFSTNRIVLSLLIIVLLPIATLAQSFIPEGKWRGVFHLTNGTEVPFNFEVKGKSAATAKVYLLNGEEHFETSQEVQKGDSLFIPFDQFDTELALKINDNQLTGIFHKKDGTGRTIPVEATFGQSYRFDENGDKPGPHDLSCRLEARPKGHQPLSVLHKADTLEQAIDGAATKLEHALEHLYGKLRGKPRAAGQALPDTKADEAELEEEFLENEQAALNG